MIKRFFKKILTKFNYELISSDHYKKILDERNHAFLEIKNYQRYRKGINVVVFSRDRAHQLEVFLRSYYDNVSNCAPISILYSCSNNAHENSYKILKKRFFGSKIKFINHKGNFKKVLVPHILNLRADKTMFFCDDNLFINKIDFNLLNKIDINNYIVSLRLHPNLNFSFTARLKIKPPKFKKSQIKNNLLEFLWFEQKGEWSDPFSIEGHLFSTSMIAKIIKIAHFEFPNSFENALKSFNFLYENKFGICSSYPIIMNLPINQVQSETKVSSGKIDTDALLDMWNNGYLIDYKKFYKHITNSIHEIHKLTFIKKS